MKKLFLLSIAMLIGMSFSYSQYQVKVEWDATDINCTCGVGIDSAFQITVYIRDIANEEDVTTVYDTAPGSADEKIVDVPDVEDYCEEYHDEIPVLIAQATVLLRCYDNPPFDACDGTGQSDQKSCSNYAGLTPIPIDAGELD
jgi:hypothetical protein